MKIGFIITSFFPGTAYGGSIYAIDQKAIELSRRGHDVTVLTSDILDPKKKERAKRSHEERGGYKINRFPSFLLANHFSGVMSLPLFFWLWKHGREFDVFHISYYRELLPIMSTLVLQILRVKVFLQTHGTLNRREWPRNWLDQIISRHQLKWADGVFVLQEFENEVIRQISPKSKRVILPNGIGSIHDIPLWKGNNNQNRVVLFLARLHPRKRVLAFIEAAQIIINHNPKIHFRIVGPDGGDETKARKAVQEFDISSNVEVVGPVPRDQALLEYANASVYVLPSIDEPFATSITEALAVGVPTLVTTSAQNLELLTRGNAVEVSEPDPISLANGIEILLNDPNLCNLRSVNGKRLVMNELTIEKDVDNLEIYYKI